MSERRLMGIDLGIASAHTVRVLDGAGQTVMKRKAWPTVESLTAIEAAGLVGAGGETRLEVVMEPTGPAWLPIAVFFSARGHRVFRVSSAKAHDLRRFLSRHTKSNGIDADTLARLALFDPDGLQPLRLPGVERAALDRRVRAMDRLTRAASEHKVRIKDLVRQLMPMTPLTGDLGVADLAVLERAADPNTLVRLGAKRLTALITKASHGQQGVERAEQWIAAASARRSSSMPGTRRSRSRISPTRSRPRCGCCEPSKSSWLLTLTNVRSPIGGSTRLDWRGACRASLMSAVPLSLLRSEIRRDSRPANNSAPSPGWFRARRRPATRTARVNLRRKPDRRCCAQH